MDIIENVDIDKGILIIIDVNKISIRSWHIKHH